MIAVVAETGRPRARSVARLPVTDALLAASGPATPSIAPLPNSSGCLVIRFSSVYERTVGISAPPAGIAPMGNPMSAPRSQAFHERFQSDRDIQMEPVIFCRLSAPRLR